MLELQRSWRGNCADLLVARRFHATRRTVLCAKTDVSRLPPDVRPTARCVQAQNGRGLPPSEDGAGAYRRAAPPFATEKDHQIKKIPL